MAVPNAQGPSPDPDPGRGPASKPGGVDFSALVTDQRARWLRGEPVAVEEYLDQHPGLRSRDDTVLDLIYNEVVLREQVGEAPRLAEYLKRFPRWAPQLAAQFEAHRHSPSSTINESAERPSAGDVVSTVADQPDDAGTETQADPDAELAAEVATFDSTIEFSESQERQPGLFDARSAAMRRASAPLPAIPGYEVLGELGRGGMGVVYLARQVRLNRPCALKTILAGDHAAPDVLLRFLAEAETIARLRHPNIVQIHSIGDHDGRPYIELEYVEGGSLAAQLNGTPWGADRAARLVETMARTMHDAHALGVVHRDLKPANVLLAAAENPKLTDFGLAKSVHSDSGLTRTESILGSPSYMAPEQAEGRAKEVGPAADTYALGAILYELLTGRPPFRAATLLDTLEQVRTTEAVPPSRLQPGLPRDLETITLKCLEKEPQRRYASALEFAEDLRRYRAGETIRAKAVSPLERGIKWVKRRPLEAAFLAVTLLALVGLTWGFTASRYEQNLARQNRALDIALADAQEQRARAKRSFDQARAVVDHFIALIEEQLDEPSLKTARDKLLADGLAYYQGVLQQWEDTPELQFELIRTYTGIAKIADSLGSKSEALKAYQQALGMLVKLVRRCPAVPQYQLEMAEVHHSVGRVYADTGQTGLALQHYETGREIRELLGRLPDYHDTRVQTDLARSHGYIGDLLLEAGRLDEAETAYNRSHQLRRDLAAADPKDPVLQFQLSRSLANLGHLNRQKGRIDLALDDYRKAIAIVEKLDAERPELREFRGDLAWTCVLLGELLLEADPPRAAESRPVLEHALTLYRRLTDAHSGIADNVSGLAESLLQLGRVFAFLGQPSDALHSCQEAREVFERLVAENPHVLDYRSGLARTCDVLAELLARAGRHDEARQSCERASKLLEQLVDEDPGKIEYHSDLGQVLLDLERTATPRKADGRLERLSRAIELQRFAVAKAPNVALYQRRLEASLGALAQIRDEPAKSQERD